MSPVDRCCDCNAGDLVGAVEDARVLLRHSLKHGSPQSAPPRHPTWCNPDVTKTIPNYLRVHRGPTQSATASSPANHESVESFWDAYHEATGWRIDHRASRRKSSMQLSPTITIDVMAGVDTDAIPAVSHSSAIRLAESATRLAEQLRQSREALRRREAELAAAASIDVENHSYGRIADRIERTLADAVAACRCDAAVMYLLDEDTQHLKARSVFGLSLQKLEQPPRELRGSRADLEALVQGVVTIDDFHAGSLDTWNSPEPFAGGICAAISQSGVPIGTLWLFADQTREFGRSESAAARMAASQLAFELQHAARSKQRELQRQEAIAVRDLAEWQFQGLPIGATLAEGWRVDGMIESPNAWATGWHAWDVLPDGSLLLAIAEAVDSSVTGAMTATIARAAMAAHTGYRHTPKQLLQRVGDTLWHTSTGEQLVSLLYARVDPETGEGEVASAGNITAMIASRYGYRPLVDGLSEPLTTHIDSRCVAETFRMMPGETLLAYSKGVTANGATQMMLGDTLRASMREADTNPLATLRRRLAQRPLTSERGVVTLTRE